MIGADSDDDELFGELMAIRPDQTDVYASSLRATVRRDLLGAAADPFRLGRFTVMEPLGGGGMGVVFVAYDPDLDRKIALKVLRSSGARGRRDILREGRALAQLRHPNVVTVYEVGVVEDREFVAMEYVEGKHLREWLRTTRSPAEILARLVEAGRGLAAAHAAGLVHHDIKPENLVIDGHGHARVIDFGLARAAAEAAVVGGGDPRGLAAVVGGGDPQGLVSVRGGTPAYMAPERLAGAVGDGGSDQYSFCVTCWEALFGARPEPANPRAPGGRGVSGWVRRALERGLARDPARRWPSMAALLAALERGATRARWWRIGAAVCGVAALGAVIAGVQRREVARRVAACAATATAIEAAWHDEARQRLRDAFVATGASDAADTAERVIPRLDEQVAAWQQARTEACLNAEVRAVWDADIGERAVFCLEDRELALTALVTQFAAADATTVREAVPAVAGLKSTDACMDPGLLQRQPPPPARGDGAIAAVRAELSRAGSLGLAGNFKAGLAAATAARVRAEEVPGWPPLWAAARMEEGRFLERTGAYEQAEAASMEAYFAAARAGAWAVAADAAMNAIAAVGEHRARFDEGRLWARHAEVAIGYAGDWHGLAEATRLNNLAVLEQEAGAYEVSRGYSQRALEIRERALGPNHPAVATILLNLGVSYHEAGAYAEARALQERVLAIWERALGPDHPSVATSLHNLANTRNAQGAWAEAIALYERCLAIREKTLGRDHPRVATTLNNLAVMHRGHDLAKAMALHTRALQIQEAALGGEHPHVAITLSNLAGGHLALADVEAKRREDAGGQAQGPGPAEREHYAEAKRLEGRALAIQEKALGPDNAELAYGLTNLAMAHAKSGDLAAAVPLLLRARALAEKTLGPEHPMVVTVLIILGERYLAAGQAKEALPYFERVVAIGAAHPEMHETVMPSRFNLAKALVATRGDRARALAEARKSRAEFQATGEADAVAEIDAWLAEQGDGPGGITRAGAAPGTR